MTRFPPNWLQQGTYAASVDRRLIGALWPAPAVTGCAVTVASGMNVNVAAGQVAVPTANTTGSALCSSDASEQVTLAAAPASGSNRYDLVVCQLRGNDIDGGSNNDFVFVNVTGTAAASPAVPAVPNNAVALAQIYVPGASASVVAGNITDIRPGPLASNQSTLMGYAQVTATQSNITTIVDLTGLSVTFTALGGGRRYKATVHGLVTSSVVADLMVGYIRDGANAQLARWAQLFQVGTGGTGLMCEASAIFSPPAGPYTVKASLERSLGTGTMSLQAAGAYPAFISVELL